MFFFGVVILKDNQHIRNQHPQICQRAKFYAKTTLDFAKKILANTVNFGIRFAFFEGPSSIFSENQVRAEVPFIKYALKEGLIDVIVC